jgi:hypothetical protein
VGQGLATGDRVRVSICSDCAAGNGANLTPRGRIMQRLVTLAKAHKYVTAALAVLVLFWLWRRVRGESLTGGHTSPDDAIAAGWSVYQAGITGWLEESPDGKTSYLHDTGWTGSPYGRV